MPATSDVAKPFVLVAIEPVDGWTSLSQARGYCLRTLKEVMPNGSREPRAGEVPISFERRYGDAIGVIPLSSRRRLRNDTRTNSILLKEKPRKVVGCFPQSFSPRAPRRIRRSVL